MRWFIVTVIALLPAAGVAWAEDSKTEPRPVPLTRPEMKQYLEDMKERKPRFPLPELVEEEKQKLGERGTNYESRLRELYLPGGDSRTGGAGGFGGGRENEPGMSLDYKFKVQLFWIVSRTNNCQY
jgi:hypothetical protein